MQEEQLRHAQKEDEVRRKKHAAQDDADRAAVLEEMRSLDMAVTEARERLRRYEAAAHTSQTEAAKATHIAEEAEARRDAVRCLPTPSVVLTRLGDSVQSYGLRSVVLPGARYG